MRKIILFLVLTLFAFSLVGCENAVVELKTTEGVTVVPTMNDTITSDSSWCGTFQLVWNDMKNELVKQDVEFTPQLDMAVRLNAEDFDETMLSDEYYFKTYGLKTLELKEKIENGIMEKFNQTSDIIDDFDWSDIERLLEFVKKTNSAKTMLRLQMTLYTVLKEWS